MMKRMVSLALALILCLSLAACGGQNNAAGSDAGGTDSTAGGEQNSGGGQAAEESDVAYIQDKGTLVVGITEFAPMDYQDENGEWIGFDADMARKVAEALGVEVEFSVIDWNNKLMELEGRTVDCLWNGMCITPERKENMAVSDPYLYNTQAMVMKADQAEAILADVSGKVVVAEAGSTGEQKLQGTIEDDETVEVSAKEYFANSTYIAVDSMAKALMEVKAGTADIALVDSVCALGMVRPESDYADLVVDLSNNFGLQEYGIAFRKGSDMVEAVNAAIAELTEDGTVAEIAERYGLTDSLIK